ncbi:MAG: flagellin [Porticoccaceae bacterium]|nr:flagellin [Porticoccaceae bacterium]
MPIVVNSNASATEASFNLSKANDALRKSLSRLSSGKRINSPADDAGGLAVGYKLNSTINRSYAVIQNSQNALSYLQVQDSGLQTVGNILDRMSELRIMAQDITKNSGDIENYSKEFVELQSQLNQISRETFNGISLFATNTSRVDAASLPNLTGVSDTTLSLAVGDSETPGGVPVQYDKFGRNLLTHESGVQTNGSVLLNVVNLQFVLSIGTTALGGANNVDLGGLHNIQDGDTGMDAHSGNVGTTLNQNIGADRFIDRILDVNVSQFTMAIERLADMRAENGAEQNRIMNAIQMLQSNVTNLEAAHGRIMDADIALESTRFARQNVLVQASASMAAQANQMTNVALMLLG